jgi:AcrR family transcriptional regulator
MENNPTKERIINTAYQLFQKNGYDQVTVNDICKVCEITKTTFYYHLKSKEEIIANFYESVTQSLAGRMTDFIAAENHWEQLMLCFETLIISSERLGPDLIGQLLIMNIRHDRGSYDFDENLTKLAVMLIEKAQKAGQIRNQSPAEPLYRVSAYAFLGYETTWCIKKKNFNRMDHVRRALENLYDVEPSLRMEHQTNVP